MNKELNIENKDKALHIADVTNRNLFCSCVRVESYRTNGLSKLICGCCDKKLTKEQSDDVGRSIASYYGW